MLEWPSRVCTFFMSAPDSIRIVAWVCPYGISGNAHNYAEGYVAERARV